MFGHSTEPIGDAPRTSQSNLVGRVGRRAVLATLVARVVGGGDARWDGPRALLLNHERAEGNTEVCVEKEDVGGGGCEWGVVGGGWWWVGGGGGEFRNTALCAVECLPAQLPRTCGEVGAWQ